MVRHERQITLRPSLDQTGPAERKKFYKQETRTARAGGPVTITRRRDRRNRLRVTIVKRQGGRLDIRQIRCRGVVRWDQLLLKCKIEDDDIRQNPWTDGGFEHTVIRYENGFGGGLADFRKQLGAYTNRDCVVLRQSSKSAGLSWESGASKQVRRESAADDDAITITNIANWRRHGWDDFVVVCSVRLLGTLYQDSICGIDDYNYAKEQTAEVAGMVADQLEADGWIVSDRPRYDRHEAWLANRRLTLRYQLNRQNRR